jgi:NADP-reducing hydrogenase subunit HndD
MKGDVDAVLTTRELAILLRSKNIPFASLSNEGEYDSPLGASTGAAQIFGATGGVMEAALRTALELVGIKKDLEFHAVRGMERIKECEIEGVGKVLVANGISAVQKLFREDPEWYKKYVFVEVMACVGGCLGGGGEPKSLDPEILVKRMKGVYSIDERAVLRKSHENPDVQKLYKEHLGKPLSEISEELLHTTYYPRGSDREKIALFLDAVDRRDAKAVQRLFEKDGIWDTNSPLGAVERSSIPDLISKLPSSSGMKRHTFVSSEGLDIIDGMGRLTTFEIQKGPTDKFQKLIRKMIG